jgi:predicted transcriptional regulator
MGIEIVAGAAGAERQVTGGYASDLLSCVMAGAQTGNVWVTLQAHQNVIAVAELLGLACVIITEGTKPNEDMVSRAEEKGIPILLSDAGTFTVVSQLIGLGVQGSR